MQLRVVGARLTLQAVRDLTVRWKTWNKRGWRWGNSLQAAWWPRGRQIGLYSVLPSACSGPPSTGGEPNRSLWSVAERRTAEKGRAPFHLAPALLAAHLAGTALRLLLPQFLLPLHVQRQVDKGK